MRMIRAYDTEPTVTKVHSRMLQCLPCREGIAYVFDRTCFFPGGGGQEPDCGWINGQPVQKVYERNGLIYHILSKPLEGEEADLIIDSEKRMDDIEVHTGEHILSGMALNLFHATNVGFHIGKDYSTADFNISLTQEQLEDLEKEVNLHIRRNEQITITYPDEKTINNLPLRKKPDTNEPLRVVTIEGSDICACCGTHGKRSGDVGLLRIIKSENFRGGTRAYFLCGRKAIEYTLTEHRAAEEAANLFSAKVAELPARILALQKTLYRQKEALLQAENNLAEEIAKRFLGDKPVIEETLPYDIPVLKRIADIITTQNRCIVILYGRGCYVLAKHPDITEDLSVRNNELKAKGAKGGGRGCLYSGRLL